MPSEVKAQDTTSLASIKTVNEAATQSRALLAGMEQAAADADTTLNDIYQDAKDAQTAADSAKQSADTAFTNLSQVQSVLEVAQWIATHGTYVKATVFNPNATYYTITATQVTEPSDDDKDSQGVLIYYELDNGIYVRTTDTSVQSGKTYYRVTGTPVAQPSAEHIADYYTLAVSEAMADYVQSHLALTDDGLYVMADNSEWKVLIKSDGVYIVDANDDIVAEYASQTRIGYIDEGHVVIDSGSLTIMDDTDTLAEFSKNGVLVDLTNATSQRAGVQLKLPNNVYSDVQSLSIMVPEGVLSEVNTTVNAPINAYRTENTLEVLEEGSVECKLALTKEGGGRWFSVDLGAGETRLDGGVGARLEYATSGYSDSQAQIAVSNEDHTVFMGVGSGGVNRGIYDEYTGEWIVYKDSNGDTRVGGGGLNLQNGDSLRQSSNSSGKITVHVASINVGTISANGSKNASVDVSIPTNYVGRAIVGFDMTGTGTASCSLVKLYFNQTDEQVVYWIRNFGNSATGTVTLRAFILCTYGA